MRHDDPHDANRPRWHQLNIQFDDHQAAERAVIAHLGPVLMEAKSTGLVTSWFFIRKQWWRFRYMPASSTSACEAKKLLEDAACFMQDSGYASRWVENIYEPETHAFGGEEGMAAAHNLFHQDSRHIFERISPLGDGTLNSAPNGQSKRRELSILLCSALMRTAGQDRYEQGDIWAKVADHRPIENSAQPEQWRTFKAAIKRLVTVNTGPETALRTGGALEFATDWLAAFEQAGKTQNSVRRRTAYARNPRCNRPPHHLPLEQDRHPLPNTSKHGTGRERSHLRRPIAAVGIRNGASHTEVMLTPEGQCTVIEIGARLGAGQIGFLIQHALGIDPWAACLDTALGRTPQLAPTRSGYATVRFLTSPRPGRLTAVTGLPRCGPRVPIVRMRKAIGDSVDDTRRNSGRLGCFVVTGPDAVAADQHAEDLFTRIRIEVAPHPSSP